MSRCNFQLSNWLFECANCVPPPVIVVVECSVIAPSFPVREQLATLDDGASAAAP